jgi:hypothetical protein
MNGGSFPDKFWLCTPVRGAFASLILLLATGPICSAALLPPDEFSFEAAESHALPVRTAAWPPWKTLTRTHRDTSLAPATPHPAVARIIVPEDGAVAYGSGTLVDVRDQYGLVVTNWHVVRDSQGVVEVVFPSGFRSHARPLKVDSDWDLAALVIWRPPIEPVKMSSRAPRPGDLLTIHGYGQGKYRIATGRCTTYYAPKADFPHEMVELDVQARQGDSGGPIFNDRGELAGVLFGAGRGTTVGAFGPRVGSFLSTLAPDIGQARDAAQIAVADRPAPNVQPRVEQPGGNHAVQIAAIGGPLSNVPASNAGPNADGQTTPADQVYASATTGPNAVSWQDVAGSGWFGFLKSTLAFIGLVAVALQFVRIVR